MPIDIQYSLLTNHRPRASFTSPDSPRQFFSVNACDPGASRIDFNITLPNTHISLTLTDEEAEALATCLTNVIAMRHDAGAAPQSCKGA